MDSVANRYAIALLSIARDENKIKEYVDEVEELISLFKENPQINILLKNYGLTRDEKKEILTNCFQNRITNSILNLFYVMIDNKRGGYLLQVCNEFVRIGMNELHVKKGIVYTTIHLSKEQLISMEKKVSKILNSNVILTNVIDLSLLGGFKIQIEDYILDDSMKSRLEKLKETIILKKGDNFWWK